jgi:hypothetical protein
MNEHAITLASVEQQLERHASNVERIQRDAIFEIGRELAAAQELFRYSKGEGGFTGWLANRLPHIPQSSAYRAIEIFKGIDPALFPATGNIQPFVLEQIAKAEPDVQALIAERVEAGEIFTAAKVKEIRETAEREAADQARAEAENAVAEARQEIADLQSRINEGAADAEALRREIAELTAAIEEHERAIAEYQESLPSPAEAEKQAAAMGGGVVLGSDLKFHSGASPEEKALSADYLTAWTALKEFAREDFPLPGRVAAGCSPAFRKQLREFCAAASIYINQLRDALDVQQD